MNLNFNIRKYKHKNRFKMKELSKKTKWGVVKSMCIFNRMFTFFLAFFSANLLVGCSSDSENSMLVVSDKANTNEIVDSEQAYMLLTTDYLDYLNIVDKELLNN